MEVAPVKKVTVQQTGTSLSVPIPDDVAERLSIKEGATLFAIELGNGVFLTPDPQFQEVMRHYQRGAEKYQAALRELAH
jgi:antitoxin component of MazEF toxin-antitoxin module